MKGGFNSCTSTSGWKVQQGVGRDGASNPQREACAPHQEGSC
eukprot:CAMPEP_0171089982 /NCGR_PEP_ID=MMETSP0766_2-20121228/28049_1 /TAXON_ID=439317 /ORGANISM="Gambierdiscus australes, Strain CAWD 149" /LENGTH=41 /DNA_ID= /DNA_START= /DNA_END= /DNA_ORIENTATION=